MDVVGVLPISVHATLLLLQYLLLSRERVRWGPPWTGTCPEQPRTLQEGLLMLCFQELSQTNVLIYRLSVQYLVLKAITKRWLTTGTGLFSTDERLTEWVNIFSQK